MVPISTKVPEARAALLRAIQLERGDEYLSDTIRAALDRFVENHFRTQGEGAQRGS